MIRLRRGSPSALFVALTSALTIVSTLFGCDSASPSRTVGQHDAGVPVKTAEVLQVAAASDLQQVLPILAARFTEQSKIELNLSFGASGQLTEQIKAGAPFDVFLAANQSFVQLLADAGLIRPESVSPYAQGSLVLAIHEASADVIQSLADLDKPEIKKISLANPETAPYGAAGKQALERAGLWPKLIPKIVQAGSVRQALQFVESGNAEAGLAGRSIATLSGLKVIEIDHRLYDPIVQGLGVITRSAKPEAAGQFTEFVLSEVGQSILKEAGFAPPGGKPSREAQP